MTMPSSLVSRYCHNFLKSNILSLTQIRRYVRFPEPSSIHSDHFPIRPRNLESKNSSVRRCFSACSDHSKSKKTVFCIDKPMKWPSGERATFHFHEEVEAIMNEQINAEFKAFYYYMSMAGYFGRVDVALPGCESFFTQMHHEEHEHALRFFNYVKMRGGEVNLKPIMPPDDEDWKCPLHAFKTALDLEIEVGEKLVAVNAVAEKHGDLNASDFIITGFMDDQMRSVNEMAKFVTILSGIGDQSLARFIFDKDLLENHVMSEFNILKSKTRSQKRKSNFLREEHF